MNPLARFLIGLAIVFNMQLDGVSGQAVSPSGQAVPSTGLTQENASSEKNSASQLPTTVGTYQTEQASLAKDYEALLTEGASTQQIHQWVAKNALRLRAQVQRAQTMSLDSANQTPATTEINRLPGRAVNPANLSTVRAFAQQNAPVLNQQRQRALAFAATSAQQTPNIAASPVVPTGASPELMAYLTSRNQLRQGFTQFQTQYATATPAARAAALVQWRKQNAALIQQMQSAAQNLTQASEQN
jgi:hypothetical protein